MGKKHKRVATHDLQRQLKVQGTSAAPPATAEPVMKPVQEPPAAAIPRKPQVTLDTRESPRRGCNTL